MHLTALFIKFSKRKLHNRQFELLIKITILKILR